MKLVIFGSRNAYPTPDRITEELRRMDNPWSGCRLDPYEDITELVSGKARGGDEAGEAWAKVFGIPIKPFPADWNGLGKVAGHIRNEEMAEYAEIGLGFWKGRSGGTANMATNLVVLNKPVRVVRL